MCKHAFHPIENHFFSHFLTRLLHDGVDDDDDGGGGEVKVEGDGLIASR